MKSITQPYNLLAAVVQSHEWTLLEETNWSNIQLPLYVDQYCDFYPEQVIFAMVVQTGVLNSERVADRDHQLDFFEAVSSAFYDGFSTLSWKNRRGT